MKPEVSICILQEKRPNIEKKFFKTGFPEEIYEIIMSIQAAYFLSHEIRKETDFFLIFHLDDVAIHFRGNRLRYLGPDERSIGMLLMKGLKKIPTLEKKRVESTPGIWIERLNLAEFLRSSKESKEIIITDANADHELKLEAADRAKVLILGREDANLAEMRELQNIDFLTLPVADLPTKMRNYLTILRFYSVIDNV